MENKFIKASQSKLRFETNRGMITTEDLWAMPLTSRTGFDLDTVAKHVNKQLRETEEESFVKPASTGNVDMTLRLEILKFVIEVKVEEAEKKKSAKEKKEKKAKILEMMERKQDAALEGKTLDELQKELDEL